MKAQRTPSTVQPATAKEEDERAETDEEELALHDEHKTDGGALIFQCWHQASLVRVTALSAEICEYSQDAPVIGRRGREPEASRRCS